MNSNVSVVVCTRNRQEYLEKCIKSLLEQSAKPKEIIIVDDASDERLDVLSIFKDFSFQAVNKISKLLSENRIDIKYIRNKKRQGIVKSRNLGISKAIGGIIAFIDDDGYAHKDWIKNLLKRYESRNVLGVGGSVVEIGRKVETKSEIKRISYITAHGDIKHNYRVKHLGDTRNLRTASVRFLMGGNMSFRRNVLLNLNGFDPKYKGNYYREETDLCLRASKLGKIIFEPSSVVYHNTAKHGGTRDIANLADFLYWYFRNTGLLFMKHFYIQDALKKIYWHAKKHIREVFKGDIKINRDYLVASSLIKILLAISTGTIAGILIGLIFDAPLKKLVYKHPEYTTLITILITVSGIQIIENIEHSVTSTKL